MQDDPKLEELKNLWAQTNRQLEASERLNALLLRQTNLREAGSSLRGLSRGIVVELVLNFGALVFIGAFAADHLREVRFFAPAVALGAYAIATIVAGIRQIVDIKHVDYDEPVVAIQKKLEQLRVRRIRTTMGVLLFAPLMWVPLLIVAMRGLLGVDAFAAGTGWLAANLLFGLAVIPLAIFLARRYGDRLGRYAPMRALADAIAGRSLASALASLDVIRRFERAD
jgi:hypothetical protein